MCLNQNVIPSTINPIFTDKRPLFVHFIIFDQLPYTADATYNRLNELKEENPNLAGKIEDIKDNIFE